MAGTQSIMTAPYADPVGCRQSVGNFFAASHSQIQKNRHWRFFCFDAHAKTSESSATNLLTEQKPTVFQYRQFVSHCFELAADVSNLLRVGVGSELAFQRRALGVE